MSGKCKYCGFVGTNDAMADHAGEMCHENREQNLNSQQQLRAEIAALADEVAQMSYVHHTEQDFTGIINGLRQLSADPTIGGKPAGGFYAKETD